MARLWWVCGKKSRKNTVDEWKGVSVEDGKDLPFAISQGRKIYLRQESPSGPVIPSSLDLLFQPMEEVKQANPLNNRLNLWEQKMWSSFEYDFWGWWWPTLLCFSAGLGFEQLGLGTSVYWSIFLPRYLALRMVKIWPLTLDLMRVPMPQPRSWFLMVWSIDRMHNETKDVNRRYENMLRLELGWWSRFIQMVPLQSVRKTVPYSAAFA